MSFKRLSPLLILLLLAGCYQQVPDAFEPVNSLSVAAATQEVTAEAQAATEEASPTVEIVEASPEATEDMMPFMPTETPTEDVMPFMPTETPTEDVMPFMPTETPTETPTEDPLAATLTIQALFPSATPTEAVVIIVPPSETPTPDPFAFPTNTLEALFGAFTATPSPTPTLTPSETPTPDPFAFPTNTLEALFGAFTATPSPTPTVVVVEVVISATPLGPVQATATLPAGQVQTAVITPRPPIQMAFPSLTPDINRGDGTFGGVSGTATGTQVVGSTAQPVEDERCFYVVRGGDTLFRISQNNNVRLADLLALNSLNDRSIIQPGQRLRLPIEGCTEASASTPAPSPAPLVTSTSLPVGTSSYTVQSGDTLAQIARRFNTTIEAIVQANALADPNRLSVGQTLIIPSGGS